MPCNQWKPLLFPNRAAGYVLIKTSIYIEMREPCAKLPMCFYLCPAELFLAVYFHVIGDHRALLVAHRVNLGDGEALVAELRERLLESVGGFILQRRGLLGRSQDSRIDTVRLAFALLIEEQHLPWSIGGQAHFRLLLGTPRAGSHGQSPEEE